MNEEEDTVETWLKFDHEDDEEASHAAEVLPHRGGYRVGWWNEAVGLVTEVDFSTLEAAHAFLLVSGYVDYTA